MQYEAVIFDLDGTLIDSMSIWRDVDFEYLKRRGIAVTPDLFSDIPEGNSFSELALYVKNKFNLEDTIEEICNEWTEMVTDHYENKIELRKGVRELLGFLQEKKVPMAIGTSNSLKLTRLVLKRNKISEYFQDVVSGDSNLRGKPYPDIFLQAAHSLGVNPENCLVIEDTLAGVRAANAAGMKVVAIEEIESKADWRNIEAEADHTVSELCQLLDCLKRIVR